MTCHFHAVVTSHSRRLMLTKTTCSKRNAPNSNTVHFPPDKTHTHTLDGMDGIVKCENQAGCRLSDAPIQAP